MLTTLLVVNAACFAGILALAKFDSRLVDEAGNPLDRNGEWRERVVPASREADTPSLV